MTNEAIPPGMPMHTGSSDFVSHEKIVYGDAVHGDKIMRDKIVADTYVQQVFVTRAEVQDIEDLAPEPGNPPYKGLHYFGEKDSNLFFGREQLIAQIVGRLLGQTQFLAIVGASGSGKSSLVRAGIIPALRRGAKLTDGMPPPASSGNWSIHLIKPTAAPLQSLADTLERDNADLLASVVLRDQMAADPRTFYLTARKLLARQGTERLLLVLDQFEELFTLCETKEERSAFLNNLLTAISTEAPVKVLITLRADFYAQCGAYTDLRRLLSQQQEYIGALSRDELYETIVKPAACSSQWKIQEGLVELMLDEVGSEPGGLPLLSHALLETWNRRRGHIMTLSGYKEAGGVRGAIAQTAEAVYVRQLILAQQPIACNIFVRLTQLGEGTQDTRRRATLSELTSSSPGGDDVASVLAILADARLVVTDRNTVSSEEMVEVAHEALIRLWPRLRDWLEEDRGLLRLRQGVQQAAAEWIVHTKQESYLTHRDERLKQVAVLLDHSRVTLDDMERAYLEACQKINYLDKANIAKAGWGVIFACDTDPAIRYALRELLDHRRQHITEKYPGHYHEFIGEAGYRPGETMREFLARHDIGSSRPTPDKMPYYLLIVGDPETIPFSFQYQLDMQYAVGRIHFDTLDEYAQYARSVVAAETGKLLSSRRAVVFAPQNLDDRATAVALQHLAIPIAAHLEQTMPTWTTERIFGTEATKDRLSQLLGGKDTPSLMFACGHGMSFPLGDSHQLSDQGALLCQDWSGPGHPVPKEHYFSAEDVSPDAKLLGSIFYFWSCYGAGTPKLDNYAPITFQRNVPQLALHAFIARLPQRLLGHPRGGALAVIGSVERKWSYSFTGKLGEKDINVFLATLLQLMEGYPVGAAMEYFNQRYAALMSELVLLLEASQEGQADQRKLAEMWTATNDARNYIILGDPATRLRLNNSVVVEQATIEPGLHLDPPEQALLDQISRSTATWEASGHLEATLQHHGEQLQQIKMYGTLLVQGEPQRTYIRACQLKEEIQQAATNWERNGCQNDDLAHLADQLAEVEALGLVLQQEPSPAYLVACRAEETKRRAAF